MHMRHRFCRIIPTILVLSASVIVGSCGNDRTPTIATPPPGQSGRLAFTEQGQTANEFDWFGWFHNDAMRYGIIWLSQYDTLAMTTPSYMMADWLVDYNTTDAYGPSDVAALGASIDTVFSDFYNWRLGRTRQQCIAGLPATSYEKAHLTSLTNAIWSGNTAQFLSACDAEVVAIKANVNLDSSQRALLLSVVAIAYHSAQLWENYCANGGQIVGRKAGRIVYIDTTNRPSILEMDAMGAIYGAFAGAVTGGVIGGILGTTIGAVITGGPGAVPGFWVGGAYGSLRGAFVGLVTGTVSASLWEGVIKPSMDNPSSSGQPTEPGNGPKKGKRRGG